MSGSGVLRNRGTSQAWLSGEAEATPVATATTLDGAVDAGIESHSSLPLQVSNLTKTPHPA